MRQSEKRKKDNEYVKEMDDPYTDAANPVVAYGRLKGGVLSTSILLLVPVTAMH
jgi:hypothetical protein